MQALINFELLSMNVEPRIERKSYFFFSASCNRIFIWKTSAFASNRITLSRRVITSSKLILSIRERGCSHASRHSSGIPSQLARYIFIMTTLLFNFHSSSLCILPFFDGADNTTLILYNDAYYSNDNNRVYVTSEKKYGSSLSLSPRLILVFVKIQ